MKKELTEHSIKVNSVAKTYEDMGYKVMKEPSVSKLPSFLKNFQPDILATNEKESVIIEIKFQSNFTRNDKLSEIAEIVNKRKGWRFELIISNPKNWLMNENKKRNLDYNVKEIQKKIIEIEKLEAKNLNSSAFILCWAILESVSRQLLINDKKFLRNKTPLVLIKTLFSFGYLNKKDYSHLEGLYQTRNQIVHGYKIKKINRTTVRKLVKITNGLLLSLENINQ